MERAGADMDLCEFVKRLKEAISYSTASICPFQSGDWPVVICDWRPVFHGWVSLADSAGTGISCALLYYLSNHSKEYGNKYPTILVVIPNHGAFYMNRLLTADDSDILWNSIRELGDSAMWNLADFLNTQFLHITEKSNHYLRERLGTYYKRYCIGGDKV